MTPIMVATVDVLVKEDHRGTLQKVANQFSISKVPAHQILYEK